MQGGSYTLSRSPLAEACLSRLFDAFATHSCITLRLKGLAPLAHQRAEAQGRKRATPRASVVITRSSWRQRCSLWAYHLSPGRVSTWLASSAVVAHTGPGSRSGEARPPSSATRPCATSESPAGRSPLLAEGRPGRWEPGPRAEPHVARGPQPADCEGLITGRLRLARQVLNTRLMRRQSPETPLDQRDASGTANLVTLERFPVACATPLAMESLTPCSLALKRSASKWEPL
jgi:hypothetical protein